MVFSLVIVLAYRRGLRFLWIAIAAHAALDFGMFLLRDYAPTPVFIGVWTLVGALAVVLAVRLWKGLGGGVEAGSATIQFRDDDAAPVTPADAGISRRHRCDPGASPGRQAVDRPG